MGKLIKGITEPDLVNPRVAIFYSKPKIGKTTLYSQLPNHLIIDVDGSSGYFKCNAVVCKTYEVFASLVKEIREDGVIFDFIVLDTFTKALDTIIRAMAVREYNKDENQAQPLTWNIEVLPYGKGQVYIREASKKLIEILKPLCKYLIISAHTLDKDIIKDGENLTFESLDMTGKLKNILAADVDALGLIYRKEKNKNYINFIADNEIADTRSKHLSGEEFLISEKNPDTKVITTHWDNIYIK